MTAALAESMHLCQAMGLDQRRFIELLDGGPLGSAYGLQKLGEMQRHEYPAGFPVRLALKDLELAQEVEQRSQAAMPVLEVVLKRFSSASEDHADQDLASVYELGRSGWAEITAVPSDLLSQIGSGLDQIWLPAARACRDAGAPTAG